MHEARHLAKLGLPIVLTFFGIMIIGVINVALVGQLGTAALGAVALGKQPPFMSPPMRPPGTLSGRLTPPRALPTCPGCTGHMTYNVAGLSLVVGLYTGAEILANQAFGAQNLARVSMVTCRGMVITAVLCIPVAVLFLCSHPILMAVAGDEAIASGASTYCK